MKTILIATAAILFLFAASAPDQSTTAPSIQAPLDQGRASIEKGDFDAADGELQKALQSATAADDAVLKARTLFYLGVSSRQRAGAAASDEDRNRLRERALDYYRQSRALNPRASGPINDIAFVLFSQGKEKEAVEVLAGAVEQKSDRFTYFAEKLGDFYSETTEADLALKYYLIALGGTNAQAVRTKLVKQLIGRGAPSDDPAKQALKVLADAWAADEVDSVLDGSFLVLESAKHSSDQTKALFALIAGTLAKKNYDEIALGQSGVTAKLLAAGHIVECSDCAIASDNIRSLYAGTVPPLDWWKVDDTDGGPVSLAAGMRALLRTLGNRALSQRNYPAAAAFFDIARILTSSLDLGSVEGLVSIYYAQQNFTALQTLDAEVHSRLYDRQINDSAVDWSAAYDYHRTLSMIYASHGKWSDPANPEAAAVPQLDRAAAALQRANEQRRKAGKPDLLSDPGRNDLLAQASSSGQVPDYVRAMVQSAERYVGAGDAVAARDRLAPIPLARVPDDYILRYASVIGTSVTVDDLEKLRQTVKSPDSLCGMLAIAATPKAPGDKERATQLLLDQYGVTAVKVDADGSRGEASLPGGQTLTFQLDTSLRIPSPR